MEKALEFARGPLFIASFGFMALALTRLVAIQLWALFSKRGPDLSHAPWRIMMWDLLSWLIPARHAAHAPSVPFIVFSFVFHAGMILVALFLADHTALWESGAGLRLPRLGYGAADVLTAVTVLSLLYLFFARIFKSGVRASSDASDYLILLLFAACFITGFFAHHPGANPLPWNVMMLLHILSGNLLLVLVPVTKMAHAVLFPFTRFSAVYWQFKPGAGDKIACTLYGKEAKV